MAGLRWLKFVPFPAARGAGKAALRDDAAGSAAKLSDAGVAGLAAEMWLPEGLFRAVIDRYPQLNRVLARRYRAPTCTA